MKHEFTSPLIYKTLEIPMIYKGKAYDTHGRV